jgi:hypothetical protein
MLYIQLISTVSHPSKYRATSIGSGLKTDPHGSVIVSDAEADNIQMKELDSEGKQNTNVSWDAYTETVCYQVVVLLQMKRMEVRTAWN